MKIYLRELRVQGLRSFAKESAVKFPQEGFLLIRGKNVDTGGSSGSGKSSLLIGLGYLLGFAEYPATQLQSWSADSLQVEGVFDRDGDCLEVRRGSSGLGLALNGVPLEGSAKQLEAELTKFMGHSPELLEALTYRSQKSPGIFLSKGDAEKKDFLARVLDLTKYETASAGSGARVKDAEAKLVEKRALANAARERWDRLRAMKIQTPPIFDGHRALVQSAKEIVDRHESVARNATNSISEFERSLAAEVAALNAKMEMKRLSLQKELERVDSLQPDYSAVSEEKARGIAADLAQAEAFLAEERAADAARLKQQNEKLRGVDSQVWALTKNLVKMEDVKKTIDEKRAQVEKLSSNVCPTCDRVWDESAAKKKELETEISALSASIVAIGGCKEEIRQLEEQKKELLVFSSSAEIPQLEAVRKKLAEDLNEERERVAAQKEEIRDSFEEGKAAERESVTTEIALLQNTVRNYKSDRVESVQHLYQTLEDANRALVVARSQLNAAQSQLLQAETEAKFITESNNRYMNECVAVEGLLKAAEAEESVAAAIVAEENDFQQLVGREGFLGSIFDEVLWEVSAETNKILAQVPNTAHVTLNFHSESSTQKGTIQRRIVPVVTVGGFETSIKAGLSGGMMTAVELAVDLAVSQVVARRSGVVPNWLVLDEAFTGLGPVEMEACMEMLKNNTSDKLVLVVDHSSEFKSLFSQFIDVEFSNGQSRIVSR